MTNIKTKQLGKDTELVQMPVHFISEAFDEFIISDSISSVLTCLIKLSIGIETYIKDLLHQKNPQLINYLDWNRWNAIKTKLIGLNKQDARATIAKELLEKKKLSRTLDYGIAIEVFPFYFIISKIIIKDLMDLKDYRNGLFHWEAEKTSEYKLSKKALRLFRWLNKFIERKNGHWLGNEFNIIDPMGEKRKCLSQIEKSLRSEVAFLVQRRIYRHNKEAAIYHKIVARLKGDIIIPDAIKWQGQPCPACKSNELQIYEIGSKRDGKWEQRNIVANCKMCDLTISDTEFEVIKTDGIPSLNKIFKSGGKIV
jgi:hypothetical protein